MYVFIVLISHNENTIFFESSFGFGRLIYTGWLKNGYCVVVTAFVFLLENMRDFSSYVTIIISFRNQLGIKTMKQNMFPRNNSYVKSIRYLFYVLLVVCLLSYLVNLNKKQQFVCEVKKNNSPLSLHIHSILHLSCGSITVCLAFLKQYLETKI